MKTSPQSPKPAGFITLPAKGFHLMFFAGKAKAQDHPEHPPLT